MRALSAIKTLLLALFLLFCTPPVTSHICELKAPAEVRDFTRTLQQAIDSCAASAQRPATLHIDVQRRLLIGSVTLKDSLTLHLALGTTLAASQEVRTLGRMVSFGEGMQTIPIGQ